MKLPDATLQAKADAVLQDLLDQMAALQPKALATGGGYWQGLATHVALPADGAAMPPDPSRKPSDGKSWTERGVLLPAAMVLATAVDVYDGPSGRGYVVRGELVVAGVRWVRRANVGPEAYREADWQPMPVLAT